MVEADFRGYTPVVVLDSKVRVLNVEERLRQKFPDVSCKVVIDPNEIEKVIGKPPPADQALVEVIIPEGMGVVIFKAWAEMC